MKVKTVRQSIFETNSSSTHSISIINKNENFEKLYVPPLVNDNNVLFPMRLNLYDSIVEGSDIEHLNCSTKDKKFSLLIHWLLSYICDNDDYQPIDDDYFVSDIKRIIFEIIPKKGEYSSIDLETNNFQKACFSYDYSYIDDNEKNIFELFSVNMLIDYCLNPDMIFNYTIIPY